MSQNGPKTKSGEVKFFQIDPDGEIKPAYPDSTPAPTEPEPLWNADVTPVEWQNEPQASGGEEPAPLWQVEGPASNKEPSVILEESAFAEPTPLLDLEAPQAAPSVGELPADSPQNLTYAQNEDDVPTLLHQTDEGGLVPMPSTEAQEAPVELEAVPESEPAPDIILEQWQEADLKSISGFGNETTEPPVSIVDLGESSIHLDDNQSQDEIPALEIPEATVTQQASTETENFSAPQPVEPDPVSGVHDLSQRFGAQLNVLQRQVQTIHTLGPDKKLNDNQLEVLRKYIALKEAEGRDLLDQKRQYQAFLQKLDGQLKAFAKKNQGLVLELDSLKAREENSRKDLLSLKEKYKEDVARMKADYEQKLLQTGKAKTQASDFDRKREEWKGKIQEELKRIRLKEKELENKYELLKRDTQALLDSKDQHVLELKRKSDALELEMDTLEEKLRQSNVLLSQMDAKKRRLIETLKLAQVLLEQLDKPDSGNDSSSGA